MVFHAKVAVSIHRGSDASGSGRVARPSPRWSFPYASPELTWSAAAVFLVALAIYLRTMLPSTGFWDTAEAQTVPYTLSIFHPTGFPTYTLVGWLWSQIPIGSVAWRMNLLSGVMVAASAGLVVLIVGQLASERHRWTVAAAAGIAGLAFAFASEPWRNALRADVHALHILMVALLIWLLVTWRTARHAGAQRADLWLAVAALVFGLGMGNHPLIGLTAFGIAAWVPMVDRHIWRRWRLVLACIALLALGLAVYAYIPLRANTPPEPPLFYARPDTWDRFRYLVFAEQFRHLFDPLANPLYNLAFKWADAEAILQHQFVGPGWLIAAVGASVLAARDIRAFVFLALLVAGNVFYSMNYSDGDIARYYMLTALAAAVAIGVGVSALAALSGRAVADASRRMVGFGGRRRAAVAAGALVLGLAALLPLGSLLSLYPERAEQGANRDADLWVASVHEALPADAVVISWWSYSTPLWYHRWVLGERPDITIIDERNILDRGYGTIDAAIERFLPYRPVYLVPPYWELDHLVALWETETIPTYPGYTNLLRVEGRPE
jgi:transmembrane protein TMEM260 (protein O-mannosyltransferase)